MFINMKYFYLYVAMISSASNTAFGFVTPTKDMVATRNAQSGSKYNKVSLSSSIDDDIERLEQARAQFESLMSTHDSPHVTQQVLQPNKMPQRKEEYIPVLTESSKRRREVEMELLRSLETSDEAIEPLVNFWLVERDHESATKMKEMEQFCSPNHEREEAFLLQTIKDYGIHWVEPVSRLALLYFAEGRAKECEYWAKVALSVKPWHFEVIQTLIMNAMKSHDHAAAQYWMQKALPSLEHTHARKVWVEQAMKDADDANERAEEAKKEAMKIQLKNQQQLLALNQQQSELPIQNIIDADDGAWQ